VDAAEQPRRQRRSVRSGSGYAQRTVAVSVTPR
jgi:hypothetical protein